jgi:hypothetical protein
VGSPNTFGALSSCRLDGNCIQTVLQKAVHILLIAVSFHSFQANFFPVSCSGFIKFCAPAESGMVLRVSDAYMHALIGFQRVDFVRAFERFEKNSLFALREKTYSS